MKKMFRVVYTAWLFAPSLFAWPVQLNHVDSLPLYSPIYPFDFLNSDVKARYAGDLTRDIEERGQISVNLFMETTNYATNQNGTQVSAFDVNGRIGLLAMAYGSVPTGQTEPTILQNMDSLVFTSIEGPGGSDLYMTATTAADQEQRFGFLSVPTQYRKIGTRFFGSLRILDDVVVQVYGGICDMRQSTTGPVDQTPNAPYSSIGATSAHTTEYATDQNTLELNLTRLWKEVFDDLDINYQDWQAFGIEDPTIAITYRHNFLVQQKKEDTIWTKFIIVPHFTLGVTPGLSEAQNPKIMLSLPFGNNGFTAFFVSGGLAMSFNDTIEFFAQGEVNQYNTRTQLMRVPTSDYQYGVFPYATKVKVTPGNIYKGSFGINAHYFLERLSGFVQVNYAQHPQDTISLVNYDSAFNVQRLAADTQWKYGAVNVGLNYDLSPNISIGGAAQFPMNRRGAYLTNTFLIGMSGTF